MTQKKIEDKSLRMTILVNFIIVIAGIWIFSVTKIQALFLDCFFSIVSLKNYFLFKKDINPKKGSKTKALLPFFNLIPINR